MVALAAADPAVDHHAARRVRRREAAVAEDCLIVVELNSKQLRAVVRLFLAHHGLLQAGGAFAADE